MANIKSAKKRILVNRTKADRNKAIKSGVKTAIKKVYVAIDAKDKEAAAAALLNATSVIDKATTKGVYHKNYASRKVSRLSKAVNIESKEKQPIPSCRLFFCLLPLATKFVFTQVVPERFILHAFFLAAHKLISFVHPVYRLLQSLFVKRK